MNFKKLKFRAKALCFGNQNLPKWSTYLYGPKVDNQQIVSLANLYSWLWQTLCFILDTATTVSDSEAKTHARRPRRRTTGGSETGQEIEKAKRLHAQGNGNSSEPDNQAAQTLSRQQIIAMVKKRFGLKPGEQNGNKPNGIQDVPPVRLFHLLSIIAQPP